MAALEVSVSTLAGEVSEFEMAWESKVSDLKSQLAEKLRVAVLLQHLLLGSTPLKNADSLASLCEPGSHKLSVVLVVKMDEADEVMWLKRISEEVERGDQRAIQVALGCTHDESVLVRTEAVRALGDLALRNQGDDRIVSAAVTLLEDADEGVRCAAVETLGQVLHPDDARSVAALKLRLEDPDELVQRAAVQALAILADLRRA